MLPLLEAGVLFPPISYVIVPELLARLAIKAPTPVNKPSACTTSVYLACMKNMSFDNAGSKHNILPD
jgi:hypothetical protein